LSKTGHYLKIFSLYVHFIFFCGHNTQFQLTCKKGHCLETPKTCTCDIGARISTVLEIIGHFLFKGGEVVGPPRMVMTTYYYMFSDTINKNIDGTVCGWGYQWFSRYWSTSGLRVTGLHTIRYYLTQETRLPCSGVMILIRNPNHKPRTNPNPILN
jgi:hypothetical protein